MVRIDGPTHGEWFIDGVGLPKEYPYENPCGGKFPIIRKIEKPQRIDCLRMRKNTCLTGASQFARRVGRASIA